MFFFDAPDFDAELRRMVDQIKPLCDATEAGQGETLRFTLTIPKEQAVLAAWWQMKRNMVDNDRVSALARPIRLHLEDGQRGGDWNRARDYFLQAIADHFERDWNALLMERERAAGRSAPSPVADRLPPSSLAETIDDDIPF